MIGHPNLEHVPEGILFDIDGTLFDTLPDLLSLTNRILSELGFEGHTRESLHPLMGMNPKYRLIHLALPDSATQEDKDRSLELWERWFPEHQHEAKPFAGIPEALSALTASGTILGVVSNKRQDAIESLVDRCFPNLMRVIVGRREHVPIKPDPAMLQIACAEVGINPTHCIYVGDTASDMTAAHRAGLTAIAATWGFQDPVTFCGDAAPDLIVDTPAALQALLGVDTTPVPLLHV